jgi:outer membrane protein TolC
MHLFINRLTPAVALIALIATTVAAQQADKVLTLQDCIRMAQSAPSTISLTKLEREIVDRDVMRARAAFKPQAEMFSGFIYTSPRLDDRSTFSFVPANGVREYATFGSVTQEFDTSGRLRAELQRARASQDAARFNFEIARRDLRRGVTIAYYRLLLTRHLVTVVGETLNESLSFEKRTKLLFEGGEVARADLVKASAQVAFLQQAMNAAELEAKLANQELASFWTKDVDEPLQIADALEEPLLAPTDESKDDVVPFQRRFEFSLFDAERRGFQAEEKIARSALMPQFSFVFQYGLDSTALRVRDRGYAAYFSLRIPVFDWFRARGESQQFQLRAEQVETNRAIATRAFSREYRNALARVKQLYEQIRLTREQVRLAEEDLQLSRVRYEGGEGTALDVVTAQNQLAQARNNYYTSVANYLNARTDLEVASGK